MKLRTFTNRYRKFSQRPMRLPTLVGVILGLAGLLTLVSFAIFCGSDTHRYIVDVQRASENRSDDPEFPLIIPAEFAAPPTERLDRDQLWRVEARIRAAADDLDPEADFPELVFGLDFFGD